MRVAATALAAALTLSAPLTLHAAVDDSGDYAKKAGNFLKNCDARKDANGQRPDPPNYVCLAFLAGLIEGYNYGAVANGSKKPYCLPRPMSLAELSDMLATVIERGVKPDMATAAVFHFVMEENFKCKESSLFDGLGDGEILLAQAEPLLKVTPSTEADAQVPKLKIIDPGTQNQAPLLPIVKPATINTNSIPSEPEAAQSAGPADSPLPGGPPTGPAAPQPVGEIAPVNALPPAEANAAPDADAAPEAAETDTPEAPVNRPGSAMGATSAGGPATAVGPTTAAGYNSTVGPGSTVGPVGEMGPDTATGPLAVPLNAPARTYTAPVIQVNPLQEPQGTLAAPVRPATPSRPVGPQGPRKLGSY